MGLKWFEKQKEVVGILLVFCLLAGLSICAEEFSGDVVSEGKLIRSSNGEGSREIDVILCFKQSEAEYKMRFTIPECMYTDEEEEAFFAAAKKEIEESFCGENESLENISRPPCVLESYQDGKVSAEWYFSLEELISSTGEIAREKVKEKTKVEAFVVLTCGEKEDYYEFAFWLTPGELTEEEAIYAEVEAYIAKQNQTEEVVTLPTVVRGQNVVWKKARSAQWMEVLVLGILVVIAYLYAKREGRQRKAQQRKRKLMLAYAEFVGKLSLLLGAGMSVSMALRKMNQMYQEQKKNQKREEPVYEELYRTICEMDNGMGELRAYQRFAERCDLQPYRKLVSLLIFGQKIGNRKLIEQLQEEADKVFLERKNTAKRLGEEAGTKVLFPMLLMLVIVMAIILIPAFLTIYKQ